MSRVAILDLPETQVLTESELGNHHLAGGPRSMSRDFAPGIIQIVMLKQRQFLSVTGATVTSDTCGNKTCSHTANGKETVSPVFSPSGETVGFDRTSGDLLVHAEFTSGAVTVEETSIRNVRVVRREFSSGGKRTREIGYDDMTTMGPKPSSSQ